MDRTLPLQHPTLKGHPYRSWRGERLPVTDFLAFDTETIAEDDHSKAPQRPVLMTATGGPYSVVVRPEEFGRFVLAHADVEWVGWNTAFDFWVVRRAFLDYPGPESPRALDLWWRLADQGRIHDTMLLDFLVRLARPGEVQGRLQNRSLDDYVRERFHLNLDKDTYRTSFGSIVGKDWEQVDRGFFDYAVADTFFTLLAWREVHKAALKLAPSERRWGLLTETLQTRAALALEKIGHNGIGIDTETLASVTAKLQEESQALVTELQEGYGIFKLDTVKQRLGRLIYKAKSGVPSIDQAKLQMMLVQAAEEYGVEVEDIPSTTRGVTTAQEYWTTLAPDHPGVKAWAQLGDTAKLLQFLVKLEELKAASVHASYRPLVRTGRTSCTGPNIQQMPREPWFRALFKAPEGKRYIIVDYSAIELVTLAAVCTERFGWSQLGKVIAGGVDPHAYTAALFRGASYDEFKALKSTDEATYKKARQAAKAVNFGVPGGLGARRLVDYARANYGVVLSQEEAAEFRHKLVTEVYPELALYLEDDAAARIAANLHTAPEDLRNALQEQKIGEFDAMWFMIERVVAKRAVKKDGGYYSPAFVSGVWRALARANRNPDLIGRLETSFGGESTRALVCDSTAATLTGRVRANLKYTEKRNTPFQGLASDGAKVALWELTKRAYKIVAFVHDEIVVEAPASRADKVKAEVEKIMIESMASVLKAPIPVGVEGTISERWAK